MNDSVVCVAAAPAPTNHELCACPVPSQPVGPTGAPMPQASATRGAGSSRSIEAAIVALTRCSMRASIGHPQRPDKCVSLGPMRALMPTLAPTLAVALTLAAALTTTAACRGARPRALTPIPAASATPLPPLEYRLRSGEPWASGSAAGRVLVIDFWATYCKPCRKAFPKLGQLAAAYPDTAVVVGVSVDEEDAVVEDFLREVPAAFLIARDPAQSVHAGPLAVSELPTLLVVDRRGRIRFRGEAMAEPDYDLLPGLVSTLLSEPAE